MPAPVADTTPSDTSFFGHPRGLSTLFFTEMWERFGFYGVRAILIYFMTATLAKGGLGFSTAKAGIVYGIFLAMVYLLSLPGGWLADNILGQQRAVLYGGIIIAIGWFTMALPGEAAFYTALTLVMFGTGLLKPNVSTIVGGLYSAQDKRRDAGFSIFYMGINVGALFGPLVAGYLAQKVDWHIGFASAGVGMALGLTQLFWGRHYIEAAMDRIRAAKAVAPAAGGATAPRSRSRGFGFTANEWKRMAAIAVFFVCGILFFAAYEQAGSTLNLFADRYTRLEAFGFSFPSSWFQSVQPVFVIILAPIFAWTWTALGSREPSISGKFALGLFFMGLSFLVLVPAGAMAQAGEGIRVSPWWLVVSYAISEFGEICLYPVGMSAVSKLSPPRIVGLMMGVWFLSISFGNKLAGWIAGFISSMPLETLFGWTTGVLVAASIVMALLIRPVSRLTGEAK